MLGPARRLLTNQQLNRNEGKMTGLCHRRVTLSLYPRRQVRPSLHREGGARDARVTLDAAAGRSGAGLGGDHAPVVRFGDGPVFPGAEAPVLSSGGTAGSLAPPLRLRAA